MDPRHSRQTRLPEVGEAGQARLAAATVAVVGCGALGTVAAENLCRAGVKRLILIDRDVVEPSNLQRQALFLHRDAAEVRPKAVAAADRLREIDPSCDPDPRPVDLVAANVETLLAGAAVVLDGTDNAATRYLLNDRCVRAGIPWVYGAAVGTEGRTMPVLPGGPCLRCVFAEPPPPGSLATCDTSGVLMSATSVVANLQAASAVRILIEHQISLEAAAAAADRGVLPSRSAASAAASSERSARLTALDVWSATFRCPRRPQRDPDCPCCGRREFPFLDAPASDAATLCGRDAVQVRLAGPLDLREVAAKLAAAGEVRATPFMVRFAPRDRPRLRLSAFADGRLIVQGTADLAEARTVAARYVGA